MLDAAEPSHEGRASEESANSSGGSLPADIDEAAKWMAAALGSSGYRADFSLDSVRDLDRFFDEQSAGGKARRGGLLAEDLGTRLFAIGAYLGATMRRSAGGVWHADDGNPDGEINVALELPDGTLMWPVQRVMKRFSEGPSESLDF